MNFLLSLDSLNIRPTSYSLLSTANLFLPSIRKLYPSSLQSISSTIYSSYSTSSSSPSLLSSLTNIKSTSNRFLTISRSLNETSYISSIENATLSIKIVSPAYATLVLAFVDSRILRPYVRYYII
jgi:hypothetical protein